MAQRTNRKNLKLIRNLFLTIVALLAVYTYIFHVIMGLEGKDYSMVTGLYWSLTVMTTLGFGDITFTSDIGKVFSIVVLLSGTIFFMLTMPFVFIHFIYTPWLEAQRKAANPRRLPNTVKNHTLLIGSDSIAINIARKFRRYEIPYCLIIDNMDDASRLNEKGYKILLGYTDEPETFEMAQAHQASLIVALKDDFKNSNIAATVREKFPDVPLAASADSSASSSVLHLAGCNYVFNFTELLGQALARRVFNISMCSNTIARFHELCIAESPADFTDLLGKSILEVDMRNRYDINVVGIWHSNHYKSVTPNTVIEKDDVLLLAGTADKLEAYDAAMQRSLDVSHQPPVIILGAGRVGEAVANTLEGRGIDFRIVDKDADVAKFHDKRFIFGDASHYEVLCQAGINETQTVVVTTHNDDLNIYLSLYCRKLRPNIQLISRATLDKNIESLYNAGATLVMSQSSFTANTLMNLLQPEQVFMLTEGLTVFRAKPSEKLVGKNLIDSGIRKITGCNIVAFYSDDHMLIPPPPTHTIRPEDELIVIGTEEEARLFRSHYT